MTRDQLSIMCREVYGTARWASALAADLTAVGRPTAPATVNHWQSGERPPAGWLPQTLLVAWRARVERLKRAAYVTRLKADELSEMLAPEPDEEPDLAPRM